MRAPPPVQITCGCGAGWRTARATLAMSAVVAFAAWAAGWFGLAQWPWAAAALLAVLPAARVGRLDRREQLVWDGQRWTLDGRPGTPQVMIDLNRWMLLRFRRVEDRSVRWLTIEPATAGASLHRWRAALYSTAAQPTPASH